MKSCTQVWKTRNLTFKGKTLIVKNFLLAQMGFETEMRGIPEKYKKEVNDLIWKFLWDNKPNQIERNVCCLNINEGGMGMINIDNFVNVIFRLRRTYAISKPLISEHLQRKKSTPNFLSYFCNQCLDTDDIWKKNINKMKSCTQVWKTRNLTFKGKTLIVKNFLLAQMGFETEIRGIPEKYKKKIFND
jgi:hypothetical protein